MCDVQRDGDLESDYTTDFSLMNNRLDSFRGSSVTEQVSAERLARAGFYFTGQADRVRCFSCKKTVENWSLGDTPIERHMEVSPFCKFLSCTHRTSFNHTPNTTLTNGGIYDEEAEDMEYQLRTGAVVDERTYPITPHMRSEEARLQTFTSWPASAPVRPRDLAQAGLYYLQVADQVQCFCCSGRLNNWEEGDVAWDEHCKHYSSCFFILGHDVGNVPFEGNTQEEESSGSGSSSSSQRGNTQVAMGSLEERLGSFECVQHPVDVERLARAGFYSTGSGDKVLCFHCGGGLKGWQPDEDPWEEHAKHYPGCGFLLAEKGQAFVNNIQLQGPRHNYASPSHQNGVSQEKNEMLESPLALKALEMGLDPSLLERIISEKISRTGSGYSSLESLMEDCLNNTQGSDAATSQERDEDPLEKLRKLQREKQCKICMDRDIGIVFIPCGHLVSCKECSMSLVKCPICCGDISQKIKTYIA